MNKFSMTNKEAILLQALIDLTEEYSKENIAKARAIARKVNRECCVRETKS
jgi:hypothetical protein